MKRKFQKRVQEDEGDEARKRLRLDNNTADIADSLVKSDDLTEDLSETETDVHDSDNVNKVESGDVDQASVLASGHKSFKSLNISEETLKAIEQMGFLEMTEIQVQSIPYLLTGRDVMGTARTGQGKTLAFLIPVIEKMKQLGFRPMNGTGAIIITPTRELGEQIFGVLRELLEFHKNITCGVIIGGTDRKAEAKTLAKGINIVVATPGRLLDHLQNTKDFMFKNMKFLVIDEADRLMQANFEEELKKILEVLKPSIRQRAVFSATLTPKTEGLVKMSLTNAAYVAVDDHMEHATVEGLQQGYIICPTDKRFLILFTFLKKNRNKKVMVFFSSCNVVKHFYDLLNYIDLKVDCIHGKQKQVKRSTTFRSFCEAKTGILLCTDVAARGLDIPSVDWIVQYDPPDDPKEYIHRVGRTARGQGATGHALLFLQNSELGFANFLQQEKVPLVEFDFKWRKIANIQMQLEKLTGENYHLMQSAKEAYKAFVRAYASHSLKDVFDVQRLDLQAVAKSFGFAVAPFVDLNIFSSRSDGQKRGSFGYQRPGAERKRKIFKNAVRK